MNCLLYLQKFLDLYTKQNHIKTVIKIFIYFYLLRSICLFCALLYKDCIKTLCVCVCVCVYIQGVSRL